MGQSLDSMTQNQSKEELLFQLVTNGNIEAIKTLCREGANLEWIDREGKTPLIIACLDSGLFPVAQTLIQLGANVNAYRPGRHAGTPLHHAAKRGLEQTVRLLLSSGANALVRNDDGLTALDVARIKGKTNVVRAIEDHISYFSGWLREFCGPGFLEALAPQLVSRKIWAVVIPCGSQNPLKPLKLQLAIYPTLQDTQPRTVVSLWKVKIEEPKFHLSDPVLTIFDQSTKTRYKFASAVEGDKLLLQWLCNACKGISRFQVMPVASRHSPQTAAPGEPEELTVASNASVQSAGNQPVHSNSGQHSEATSSSSWLNSAHGDSCNGWGSNVESKHSVSSCNGWMDEAAKEDYNGWGGVQSGPGNQGPVQAHHSSTSIVESNSGIDLSDSSAPSAPPIPEHNWNEGPIAYPSIDYSPVDLPISDVKHGASISDVKNKVGESSSCIICWEASVEGACIPCGHMAGCMACLTEIKAKKGCCPVCRAKIQQVIKLYAV